MKRIERSVEIDAPAERVWDVLVDFAHYPEWNPLITSVDGRPLPGTRLHIRVHAPNGPEVGLSPRVRVARPDHELRWVGRLFLPGLFEGEHSFVLEPTGPTSCRLVQSETFRGALVRVVGRELDEMADGFDRMNRALKDRAEHPLAAVA